jgi:hypothetical protein
MAGKLLSSPTGVQAHLPLRGTSSITTNTRVRTSLGYVGLVTDTVVFSGGTGMWFLSNQRVRVNNMPTIGASSVGISVIGQSQGTMTVVQGDSRIEGM